jgi:hypothetical protein
MNAFIRRFIPSLGHLSDETLSRLINDELGSLRDMRAQAHLASCWQCRARCEQLEKAALQVVEYRKFRVLPKLPQDPKWRGSFLSEVEKLLAEASPTPWWRKPGSYLHPTAMANMNPVIASVAVIAFAVITLIVIWQRSATPVSAAQLLDRAQSWDGNSKRPAEPGVVYQKIRIRTPSGSFERDLYRDREGRRRPKADSVSSDLKPLSAKLGIAGVNWEQPLSASDYKTWRDGVHAESDEVKRSGKNLLTLTTKTSSGIVVQESFTVQQEDFHPVERTVELLDIGTVEIDELNYAVLGWDAVNEAMFEPLMRPVTATGPRHGAIVATLPTALQLEESELQARLALNRLDADTSEQIRVVRTDTAVEVKGVVETNERKRQVVEQLQTIPLVSSSILSFEELSSDPSGSSPVTSVKQYSLVGQPSPLGRYMKEKGDVLDDVSQTSEKFLDSSLKIQQGSSALSELLDRFGSPEQLSLAAQSARSELIAKYLRNIRSGLDAQETGLRELGFASKPTLDEDSQEKPIPEELIAEARHNQTLSRELIAGGEESPRTASAIASELFESIARVRFLVSQFPDH